jgi:hypothetical protein
VSEREAPRQWCEEHWQPYRERQGNGLLATVLVMQATLDDQAFMLEARTMYGRPGTIPTDVMNTVLVRHSPICCYLGDARMAAILEESQRPPKGA